MPPQIKKKLLEMWECRMVSNVQTLKIDRFLIILYENIKLLDDNKSVLKMLSLHTHTVYRYIRTESRILLKISIVIMHS